MIGSIRVPMGMRAAAVILGAVAAFAVAAPGGPGSPAPAVAKAAVAKKKPVAPRPVASRPTTVEAWTARVVVPVHARTSPKAAAKKIAKLRGVAPYNGNAEVLLVVGATSSVKRGVWYRVLLNDRPNDATGWIPAAAVQVRKTPYRVVVDISERRVELLRRGKVIGAWAAAVGTSANPTPTGSFAVSEIVRQRPATGFFGTYIITLSAHSEHLNEFDGGDGRVALHGTSQPQYLGQAVSHGCVRLSNAVATRIARVVPPGAPVDIVE